MSRINWRNRALERRIRRTCYYGHGRPLDKLSLSLTEAAVEYFTKNAPFDDLNFQYASDVSYAGAVSPSVLIVAMIYLERMRTSNKSHFESSDPADLFISALLCASKFLYDEAEPDFVYNDEWALSCGRSLGSINKLEVDFLNALNWDTMAREKEFNIMLRHFELVIAKRQFEWRGFGSYSDLSILVSSMTDLWKEILLPVFALIGLTTLAYTAAIFGLYTCSLYSTLGNQTHSAQQLFTPLSMPSSFESPVFSASTSKNAVQPTSKQETTKTSTIRVSTFEFSNFPPFLKWSRNKTSCAKEVKEDKNYDIPGLLAMGQYTPKIFSIWSV